MHTSKARPLLGLAFAEDLLPADGAVIVFDVVPAASWATAGVTYRVERESRSFRFQNIRTGAATFDRDWAVARSTWRHA